MKLVWLLFIFCFVSICVGNELELHRKLISLDTDETSELSVRMAKVNSIFDSTVRSCIGNKCFDEKPNDAPSDRIGLLGVKLSGVDEINDALKDLLGVSYSDTNIDKGSSNDPRIVQSLHVPAYGYGKNHGWSRIIRVVRRPVEHAVDIVKSLVTKTSEDQMTRYVDAQVRQIVRWQCRLSHVAAHTKMLTGKSFMKVIV